METWLGVVLAFVLTGVIVAVRAQLAARRQSARPVDRDADIPAMLVGSSLDYPGFWRRGAVQRATAEWRPRSRLGLPVSLSGSRVVATTSARWGRGPGQFQIENVILTCVDRRGERFQLAVFDASAPPRDTVGEASLDGWLAPGGVARRLGQAVSSPAAAGTEMTAEPSPRWRWLRQRLPVPPLVILVVCLLGAGFAVVPWIGAYRVDTVVTSYKGEPRLCEVAGTDPERGTRVAGLVQCQGRREGDPITVWVFGWPRTGTVEDPVNSIAMGSIAGGLGMFIFTLVLVTHYRSRRSLRQQPLPT